jgi:gluconate 2-dehydrogenase gamma chain
MFRRREMLAAMAAAALAGPLELSAAQAVHEAASEPARPKALTQHEFESLRKLCELIVPGASKGGAAEFIDLLSSQNAEMLIIYTGGLAWLDFAMNREYSANFLSASAEQQKAMLDKIAYRRNETPDLAAGIRFFEFARRMTVDAYYTSAAGIKQLGYMGNKGMKDFKVPAEAVAGALRKSGLG